MAYASITKPSDYFDTLLYTGNSTGSTTQAITGVGFQPDWVWLKSRDTAERHWLVDAVRGVTKGICSHTNEAEFSNISMVSFDSNGFTVGTDAYSINKNNDNYASWNWKANGQGSSNTDGTINSTYTSANTTSGFSIVTYTGTGSAGTVGHGLGVKPSMVIIKELGNDNNWHCYHKALGSTQYLLLDSSNAVSTYAPVGIGTLTTSTFSVGTVTGVNRSGGTYVAYVFAEKKGYSKISSYTGNGNADGPFVYTGFKPAFVFIKRTDSTNSWHIIDNKRNSFNLSNKLLFPDLSDAEATSSGNAIDIISNGFKPRGTGSSINSSGGSYIYMAFAEEPLVANVGNSIPATAR